MSTRLYVLSGLGYLKFFVRYMGEYIHINSNVKHLGLASQQTAADQKKFAQCDCVNRSNSTAKVNTLLWAHYENDCPVKVMKIRSKLIIGFTATILFSGVMEFSAADEILRTSRLTNELFEYPLMASNFARGAQTAFVRIRVAGGDEPVIAVQERALREDLAIVKERLRDPVGADLIAHIEHDLQRLAWLRARKARLIEQGGRLGGTLLKEQVAFSQIDANLETLVELAVVEGFDFMLAARTNPTRSSTPSSFSFAWSSGSGSPSRSILTASLPAPFAPSPTSHRVLPPAMTRCKYRARTGTVK